MSYLLKFIELNRESNIPFKTIVLKRLLLTFCSTVDWKHRVCTWYFLKFVILL